MRQERQRLLVRLRAHPNREEKRGSYEWARREFAMMEKWLDRATVGPAWLGDQRVAKIVSDALHYRDGKKYRLDVFSIMLNHVHVVFKPKMIGDEPRSLSSIMHSLKLYTAREANKILQRSGAFWEHESFDHYIRNDAERKRIIKYVLENPVKAGLVKTWQDWPWNYVRIKPSEDGS